MITKEAVEEIKKNVRCPQLGSKDYGKWGALRFDQRFAINELCDSLLWYMDYVDSEAKKDICKNKCHKIILDNNEFEEQLKHWYTELFELTKAIYNPNETYKDIVSELADNYNFLDQIALKFGVYKNDIYKEQMRKNIRTLKEIGKYDEEGVLKWVSQLLKEDQE